MRQVFFIGCLLGFHGCVLAQELPIPKDVGATHPRCYGKEMTREGLARLLETEEWAQQVVEKTRTQVTKYLDYCEKEPDWLRSRLQMYWKTKATTPYINGGVFDHAEGEAPVPTVMFPGTRDHTSNYRRPRLEDILPYMEDPRGLYYQNKATGAPEWTSIASTARNLESVNREILKIARNAAFLYWYTKEEKYAKLAFGVLDTYLMGLYYREEPVDISHGHHQTLVGLTSFEVIQEHYIAEVTETYDLLYDHLKAKYPEKIPLYTEALRKWAEQVIKNGVSFNNWNLFQAGHVSRIALVLENDKAYENGKGAQYYLDRVMNQSSVRQWSMRKLIQIGYDKETGIWFESPSYALGVLRDFIHFARFYDRNFDIDLIEALPVLRQAVISSVAYLFPNGYTVGFGDGHYKKLDAGPFLYLIENAQKFGKPADETLFTQMLKAIFDEEDYAGSFKGKDLADLFVGSHVKIDEDIDPEEMEEYTSSLFYAPNTSWLVQRQFHENDRNLMISQVGSLGNHMHSNGMAMELYGYGMPLAPDMGHGSSYFSIEYKEYYTQFPAHNTVAVNGGSKYPEMKANHPFTCLSGYPKSGQKTDLMKGSTYSDLYFLEPETYSDQRRVMGIISDGESGYYIDIFRSRQIQGNDKKHEYFYHNLGQELELMDVHGKPLEMQPTQKMAFGDGDLMAYDYFWDKTSVVTSQDVTGQFRFEMGEQTIHMNVWTRGGEGRELFSAMGPKNTAFRHGPIPEKYNDLPVPLLVVRQNGEAWKRPFVAVYEPAKDGATAIRSVGYFGEQEQVGIHVINKSGKEDFMLSNVGEEVFTHGSIELNGTYGTVSKQGADLKMLLGHGRSLRFGKYLLRVNEPTFMTLEISNEQWSMSAGAPASLIIAVDDKKGRYQLAIDGKAYAGVLDRKAMQVHFQLPKMEHIAVKLTLLER